MGHAIIILFFGLCGLLLPKEEKQMMMNKEAYEWLLEQEEK